MGRWLSAVRAEMDEKNSKTPRSGTDKTDETSPAGVLSVLSVHQLGVSEKIPEPPIAVNPGFVSFVSAPSDAFAKNFAEPTPAPLPERAPAARRLVVKADAPEEAAGRRLSAGHDEVVLRVPAGDDPFETARTLIGMALEKRAAGELPAGRSYRFRLIDEREAERRGRARGIDRPVLSLWPSGNARLAGWPWPRCLDVRRVRSDAGGAAMTMLDPRLSKLSKIVALHDDGAATEGQRAACRHVGGKLAAELGIEFSKEAIDRAMRGAGAAESAFSFDVDAWVREWEAKRQSEQAAREATLAKVREEEKARRRAERKAERERLKRVCAGSEPPRWDDLDNDHVEWLSRVEAIHIDKNERAFVASVRAGVGNGCLGLFGDSLSRMNALLRAAFEGART